MRPLQTVRWPQDCRLSLTQNKYSPWLLSTRKRSRSARQRRDRECIDTRSCVEGSSRKRISCTARPWLDNCTRHNRIGSGFTSCSARTAPEGVGELAVAVPERRLQGSSEHTWHEPRVHQTLDTFFLTATNDGRGQRTLSTSAR